MSRPIPPQTRRRYWQRVPLMGLAAFALLAGLWAGLLRLGWQLPPLSLRLPAQHDPLMVSGFLGTLISLERAVALSQNQGGRRRYYLAPLLARVRRGVTVFDTARSCTPRPEYAGSDGAGVHLCGHLSFAANDRPCRDGGRGTVVAGGQWLWLVGWPIFRVAPWWAGFLILTIAGERLALTRVLLHKKSTRQVFVGVTAVFLVGLLLSLLAFDAGLRLAGVGLIALGIWLMRYDIARRTIRQKVLTASLLPACCQVTSGWSWAVCSGCT